MRAPALNLLPPLRALVLSLSAMGLSAHAALFSDDEARRAILDLRERVQQLQNNLQNQLQTQLPKQLLEQEQRQSERLQEEGASLRRLILDLQAQIDLLRTEQSQLRGQNEQLQRDLALMQRATTDLQKSQRDLLAQQSETRTAVDDRLRRFEPVKVTVDGQEFMAEPAERRDFEAGLAVLRQADYGQAQKLFEQFIARYPQSGYVPSALFWLGNAAYVNKAWRDAGNSLRQMLQTAPSHSRAPDAMLALSNVQIELKDTKGARSTLQDLIKQHPQSEAAQVARERLPKLR